MNLSMMINVLLTFDFSLNSGLLLLNGGLNLGLLLLNGGLLLLNGGLLLLCIRDLLQAGEDLFI